MATKTTAAKTKTAAAPSTCACGCGESVVRTFKQGHDQKLVSKLAEDIVYASVWDGACLGILKTRLDRAADIQDRITKVAEYMRAKLTPALADKFVRAAERQWELEKDKARLEQARAERKLAAANKPKRTKKAAAVPSEEAGATVTPITAAKRATVTATATNDDVDKAEAAADAAQAGLGQKVKIKAGKRTRNATVTGMNQAGKVTAVTFQNAGKDVVRTEGQFELVTD